MARMMKMGPLGWRPYRDEKEWNEMGNNIISHIIVSYTNVGVVSIQFGYVNNGALAFSKMYGPSPVGYSCRIVRLNHESEFVTGLSGEIYNDFITSLTFHTNQRKHEVLHLTFDSKDAAPRKMELHSGILEPREFGGFCGTVAKYNLISIGFYVKFFLPDVKMVKEEKV